MQKFIALSTVHKYYWTLGRRLIFAKQFKIHTLSWIGHPLKLGEFLQHFMEKYMLLNHYLHINLYLLETKARVLLTLPHRHRFSALTHLLSYVADIVSATSNLNCPISKSFEDILLLLSRDESISFILLFEI